MRSLAEYELTPPKSDFSNLPSITLLSVLWFEESLMSPVDRNWWIEEDVKNIPQTAVKDFWFVNRNRTCFVVGTYNAEKWGFVANVHLNRGSQKSARRMRYFTAPIAAWYLRKGRLTLRFADGEEKYRAGAWVFPRHAPGEQCFSDNAELVSIRFFSEWPNSKSLFDRSATVHFSADRFTDLLAAAEGMTSYISRFFKRSSIISTESTLMHYLGLQPHFHQWIFSYYKTFVSLGYEPVYINQLSPIMERALHYLQGRPVHTVFKEAELAQQMQMSISQLNRLFCSSFR